MHIKLITKSKVRSTWYSVPTVPPIVPADSRLCLPRFRMYISLNYRSVVHRSGNGQVVLLTELRVTLISISANSSRMPLTPRGHGQTCSPAVLVATSSPGSRPPKNALVEPHCLHYGCQQANDDLLMLQKHLVLQEQVRRLYGRVFRIAVPSKPRVRCLDIYERRA